MNRSIIKKALPIFAVTLLMQRFCFAENHSLATTAIRDPFVKTTSEMSTPQTSELSLIKQPLTKLQLTGILQLGNDSLAIFRDSNGRLHPLKIGATVGMEGAKITGIFSDKVVLTTQSATQMNSLPMTTVLNLP